MNITDKGPIMHVKLELPIFEEIKNFQKELREGNVEFVPHMPIEESNNVFVDNAPEVIEPVTCLGINSEPAILLDSSM